MKTKFIYIVTSTLLARREDLTDPGDDPEGVPIDDYIWVLALVALVFAVIKLRAYAKQTIPSLI